MLSGMFWLAGADCFIYPCDEIPLCLSQINLLQDWCSRGRSSCLFCVGWGGVRVQNRNSVFTQNSLSPLLTLIQQIDIIYIYIFICKKYLWKNPVFFSTLKCVEPKHNCTLKLNDFSNLVKYVGVCLAKIFSIKSSNWF